MVSVFSNFAGGSTRRYTANGTYAAPTNLPSDIESILVYNATANLVFILSGPSGVSITVPTDSVNGAVPVPPGQQVLLNFTGSHIAVQAATGTPDVYVTYGTGA